MGLNRMMMKNGEVKVEDGSKYWTWNDANNKTISFTVPPGIKRIKVTSSIDGGEGDPDLSNYANIKNTSTNKVWGEGWFYTTPEGEVDDAADGVTYEINSFVTKVEGGYIIGRTSLSFKDDKIPKGDRIIIEVNGSVYTLTNYRNTYYVDAKIFTSMNVYKIKILSIE